MFSTNITAANKSKKVLSCAINNCLSKFVTFYSNSSSTTPPHNPFMGTVVGSLHRRPEIINMNSPQAELVRKVLDENKVVIFSKSYCPYCNLAKEQFRKLSVTAFVFELDGRNDSDEIQNFLGEITGGRTVPRCFIDGKFIGGGTDVKRMYETGSLQKYFS